MSYSYFVEFEKLRGKYFRSANELEYDIMVSEVILNKYRKEMRKEYGN